ncbi:MAG: type VI secretion system ImpA family N-terminal domain-containing protein [Holosporales bacterium]|jgi:type VI secretion system protein ImpA|nr:type VI secretion system ImpA family N-terminal domain-containing protein [Holosporales bacterium]
MTRIEYQLNDLFSEIEGSPDGVGYDISLSHIYDNIKSARFEEDAMVSFGIWERELKKADWILVEKLTVDALIGKSKDLQIVGWLIESLILLDGFNGILFGIKILIGFLKTFWKTSYPRNEDGSSDEEQKLKVLDWIYDTIEKKLKLIPFAWHNENDGISLYDYDYAVELKNSTLISPNLTSEILKSAKKAGIRMLDEIQGIINLMNRDEVFTMFKTTNSIKEERLAFVKILETLNKPNDAAFFGTLRNVKKIETILTMNNKTNNLELENNLEIKEKSVIEDRDSIYNEIDSLAQKLAAVEKHSPSSYMLNLVVSWKDKNLLEIMDDLKSGNSEAHRLLKFLIN